MTRDSRSYFLKCSDTYTDTNCDQFATWVTSCNAAYVFIGISWRSKCFKQLPSVA